jgi:hypothetical protein
MKVMRFVLPVLLCLSKMEGAEEPVPFADPRLKAVVEATLWISDPAPADMLNLTSLTCIGEHPKDDAIESLVGLEYATNLQSLTLSSHRIGSISPLSKLTRLRRLLLDDNQIDDISAVSGLTGLWTLGLSRNSISDISALSALSDLGTLSLHRNRVSDISPLAGLTSLSWVDLRINPLDRDAYDTYIPQILGNNPGIWFVYDPSFYRRIIIDCTVGGHVTSPGEGAFAYEYGESIWLTAEPDPGYVFEGWQGEYSSGQNPAYLLVDQDYTMQACFVRALDKIYVDDDAPNDPGPVDPTVSDPNEDGTPEHPFDRIQEAIRVAGKAVSILVHPGTYHEDLTLPDRNMYLIGIDPDDPNGGPHVVIEGTGTSPVVRCSGSTSKPSLTGFVITGGKSPLGAAVYCDGVSPTITQCLIVGNRSTAPEGATVYCKNSRATLSNCTIADNYGGESGTGLLLIDSDVTMTNSILWGNHPTEILAQGSSHPAIRYCDVQGWWPDYGNLHADPLFARPGSWVNSSNPLEILGPADTRAVWREGDYHLKSQAGRWDPDTQNWVQDTVTSPCVDGGAQASPVEDEPPRMAA